MDQDVSRYDVFISYSHEDAKKYGENAIQLIKDMIEADLHDSVCRPLVFLDSEALKFGDEWHAKIMDKLNECRVFICLLSENYLNSSYCTRERLWWEKKEIWQGRLRQTTLPVYYIRLDKDPDPLNDDRRQVRDLFGFQMNAKPWFEEGANEVKKAYLEERITELKKAVQDRLSRTIAAAGFNTVFPEPSKSFVGRIVELRELREICKNQQYPIIEGGAGVGKSELATVYAYGYADEYPQGRFLIHMEGKKNWEEAVISLVKDPDTGIDVQEELEISDEDMKKESKDLHRLIVRKLFARAKEGGLLLLLDNVDDASLFNDQRLQEFSIRTIPPTIHMIATTRHKLEFHKLYRAKAYPIENLDDDASFELFCEIGENRYPFCTKPILDRTSDPEYAAVMEIIHLLEGHVWSMEIIAGQIALNYKNGVTFRMKLSMLKEQFSINDDGYLRRNVAENPEELLQATLDILKKCENGDVIVQLAYFAAMLAPDGKKTAILRACWNKLFSDVKFRERSEDTFKYAYNHLWQYNLIHGENDDKMHRLTQAALKQIMKDEGIFDEFVGKLTDVMVQTSVISYDAWLETISATPEIAVCLQSEYPKFFSVLLSPGAWIRMLTVNWKDVGKVGNPSTLLIDMCPWDKLNGLDWERLLCIQPQFADKCQWDKLDKQDWIRLLCIQPRFAENCPEDFFDKLESRQLEEILRMQPQLADKCPLDQLESFEWADLLREQPRFADRCNKWDVFSGEEWVWILQNQPQFADKCHWDKLDQSKWISILRVQPQIIDKNPDALNYFSWDKLNIKDWIHLLRDQPQFAGKFSKWERMHWCDLLLCQPQFADKCDKWDKLSDRNWCRLLCFRPQFADKCDKWDKLDGSDWVILLCRQPQFADKCDKWDKLDGSNWVTLLRRQPQFADRCPWDKLDGENWSVLLQEQPQFANRCQWNKLDSGNWSRLLSLQPQFADRCDKWDRIIWSLLLRTQPQFADRCDKWDKIGGKSWCLLLSKQPQFANKCSWEKLKGEDWAMLLLKQPQFSEKCPSALLRRVVAGDKLTGEDWNKILRLCPSFADKCPQDILGNIIAGRAGDDETIDNHVHKKSGDGHRLFYRRIHEQRRGTERNKRDH